MPDRGARAASSSLSPGRPGSSTAACTGCGSGILGAREAFQQIVNRGERSPETAVAHAWLGEIAFQDGRYDDAERQYRLALPLNPPAELAAHASLGLAWTALRRGDFAEAQRALAGAVAGTPSPRVTLFARFLDGVARLLAGRPQEALPLWEAVATAGPPPQLAEELWFWRGAAHAQLRQADAALRAFDGFLGSAPASHPLRADAVVQSGWAALLRPAPDDALRRFLWAQGSSLRPELVPQLRAGLARAYLAVGDSARARDAARALKGESPRDPRPPGPAAPRGRRHAAGRIRGGGGPLQRAARVALDAHGQTHVPPGRGVRAPRQPAGSGEELPDSP